MDPPSPQRGGVITVRQAQEIKRKREGASISYRLTYGTPKSKTGRRSVDIAPALVELLKRHKLEQKKDRLALCPAYQDNGLVCCLQDGRPIRNDYYAHLFPDAQKEAARKTDSLLADKLT